MFFIFFLTAYGTITQPMVLSQILFILNVKNDRTKQTLIECLQHHLEEERDGEGIRSSGCNENQNH